MSVLQPASSSASSFPSLPQASEFLPPGLDFSDKPRLQAAVDRIRAHVNALLTKTGLGGVGPGTAAHAGVGALLLDSKSRKDLRQRGTINDRHRATLFTASGIRLFPCLLSSPVEATNLKWTIPIVTCVGLFIFSTCFEKEKLMDPLLHAQRTSMSSAFPPFAAVLCRAACQTPSRPVRALLVFSARRGLRLVPLVAPARRRRGRRVWLLRVRARGVLCACLCHVLVAGPGPRDPARQEPRPHRKGLSGYARTQAEGREGALEQVSSPFYLRLFVSLTRYPHVPARCGRPFLGGELFRQGIALPRALVGGLGRGHPRSRLQPV